MKIVGRTNRKNVNSLSLKFYSNYEGGDCARRDCYKLIDASTNKGILPDLIFSDFFSFSPTKKYILLARDFNGREAIYELTLFDNEAGILYSMHLLAHGTTSVKNIDWVSDCQFSFQGKLLTDEEVIPGVLRAKDGRFTVLIENKAGEISTLIKVANTHS